MEILLLLDRVRHGIDVLCIPIVQKSPTKLLSFAPVCVLLEWNIGLSSSSADN
jgi:hypothetical protein